MKGSSKRMLSILTSLLLLVGLLIFYTYFVSPAYGEVKDLRGQVATKDNLLNEYRTSLKRVQKLLDSYQNVVQVQDSISNILPTKQNVPAVVAQISGLANINKLAVDLMSVQQLAIKPSLQPPLVKGLGTLRLSFRLSGDYNNFKLFLQNLETNVNLMDLVNVKVEPAAKIKAFENKFFYTTTVDTYYQAE